MAENTNKVTKDRVYLLLAAITISSSAITYYIFRQFLVNSGGVWIAPRFIPIHNYAIVIFIINFILSIVAYKKDRFLSLAFNFTTIAVDIMLVIALVLNLNNPNG